MQDRYGSPDVLELEEVDDPVRRRRRGAGPRPRRLRQPARLAHHARASRTSAPAGRAAPAAGQQVRGSDVAGRVEAVGRAVTRFRPGDEVFGDVRTGGFAEYVCVPRGRPGAEAGQPRFEQAAAVPLAAVTALQGLRDHGRVQPGQQVLINGASGGVGTFAVQLAKPFGAEVTGVCSTEERWTWSARSAPTTSSTTPGRTSPGAASATTSSSSWPGTARRPSCRRALTPRGRCC